MRSRAPWWFITLIIIALFPLGSMPMLMSNCPDNVTIRTFVRMYPLALLVSGWSAYVSYRDRRVVAWIMLIFMALIDASTWYLAMTPMP